MLDDIMGSRVTRTPSDYADRIIAIVSNVVNASGAAQSLQDFESSYLNETADLVSKGIGGDELFARYVSTQPPEGKATRSIVVYAYVALAFAIQSWWAEEDGKVAEAWTYAMDGMFAVGAMVNADTAARSRTIVNKDLNDKKRLTSEIWKTGAASLWENWQEYPDLYESKELFDKEAADKLKVKPETIRKWRLKFQQKKGQV